MKIKPDDHWRWYFDNDHDRIMLDLANGMIFRSCFPSKMLTAYSRQESSFSVDDAAKYYTFEENARLLKLSNQLQAELVLNSLIALRFLKPQMPKSWYFSTYYNIAEPLLGQIIQVTFKETNESAIFIVAEAGESASLCLLAQQSLALPDRTLKFCDPIKIMNDRMCQYTTHVKSLLYGNAG